MTLHADTQHLWHSVHRLRDELLALRLLATEDRPRGKPNKLVDDVGAAAEALAGWSEELLADAADAVAAADRAELNRLRRAMDRCSDATQRLGTQMQQELAAASRLERLRALARGGDAEVRAWVGAVEQAVDRVQPDLWSAQAALITCWRGLAERAVLASAPDPPDSARRM